MGCRSFSCGGAFSPSPLVASAPSLADRAQFGTGLLVRFLFFIFVRCRRFTIRRDLGFVADVAVASFRAGRGGIVGDTNAQHTLQERIGSAIAACSRHY